MARKTNKKKSNTTILIVTEGSTEKLYLDSFRQVTRTPGINISPREAKHSTLEAVLEVAIKGHDSRVYDIICCVFDRDSMDTISSKAKKHLKTAQRKKIVFLDSNPAFEIWFLAHFKLPKIYYQNQEKVIAELKNYIHTYSKEQRWQERQAMFPFLQKKLETAFENCEKMRSRDGKDKSYSNVDKLFLEILNTTNACVQTR